MAINRRAICERILKLTRGIAGDVDAIADAKEKLRKDVEDTGQGFTEEVPGLGSVEVKAGCKGGLKGILPVLVPDAFLDLTDGRRKALIEGGIVVMEEQRSKDTRPAVTVRPAA
jgi:hypothetical protein